jgi:hypothetical protein
MHRYVMLQGLTRQVDNVVADEVFERAVLILVAVLQRKFWKKIN